MGYVNDMLRNIPLPRMVRIRQDFDRTKLEEPVHGVRDALNRPEIMERILPGMSIAITVGSRGVANIAPITREIVRILQERGAKPFIIPAMGSHGGSSAEGQRDIVLEYGCTEEYLGCPVRSTMDVVQIGTLDDDKPIYIDRFAYEADGIIPVNRIKAHTAFHRRYESGVMKMMAIGLGKQKGAETVHRDGIMHLGENVEKMAFGVLKNAKILFGVGLLENAYDETMEIHAMTAEEIPVQEPLLLQKAKEHMSRILIDKVDVMIVDYIGKNISGEGMDPNVAGRYIVPNMTGGIDAFQIGILDLTEETLGNFVGLGMADVCSKRVIDKISLDNTYPNSLTSTVTCLCKLPMYFDNHKLTMQAAVKMTPAKEPKDVTMIRIRDTLSLSEIEISENLLPLAKATGGITILSDPHPFEFDDEGNLFA